MANPTAVSMKLRFPEFVNIDDATIGFAIEEASRNVDDTWLPKDKNLAWMYYAAHILELARQRAQSGTGQVIASETFGPISVSYQKEDISVLNFDRDIEATWYGKKFMSLCRANFPPIAVV